MADPQVVEQTPDQKIRQASRAGRTASALGTAPLPVKPPLPTGPKPTAIAPVAAPTPAPAPAPYVQPTTVEGEDAMISAGFGSSDENQIQQALRTAEVGKLKADREFATESAKQKAASANREASIAEDFATQFKDTNAKQKAMLNSSYGQFAPTKESAKDIAGLFSILTFATMGAGTENKYYGMNALSALTGAMKGYKEGREDLYKKALTAYDKNVAEFTKRTENSLKELKLAQEELSVNKDAAMARAKAVAASEAGSIAAYQIRSGSLSEAIKTLEHQATSVRTLKAKAEEATRKHEEFLIRQEGLSESRAATEAFRQATLGLRQERLSAKEANIPDAISYVKKFTGGNVNKATAPEILIQAGALGDAYGLKAEIEKHPEWVGRTGQVKNIFNRTIDSLNTGTVSPDDNGQPELIFAKRYAEYLVNYERSLAGGAKGFTVAFQNRFNKLLEQNQFNAAGFGGLMDEQMRTITSKASATSPSINKKNLTEMALDIKTRAEDYDTADAIRAYSSGKSVASPKDSEAYSDAEKERRYQEWKAKNP